MEYSYRPKKGITIQKHISPRKHLIMLQSKMNPLVIVYSKEDGDVQIPDLKKRGRLVNPHARFKSIDGAQKQVIKSWRPTKAGAGACRTCI